MNTEQLRTTHDAKYDILWVLMAFGLGCSLLHLLFYLVVLTNSKGKCKEKIPNAICFGSSSEGQGDYAMVTTQRMSVLIYLSCLTTLSLAIAFIVYTAPPAPKGGVCDGVDSALAFRLIPKGVPSKREQEAIVTLWRCTTAYQATNWWFVLSLFPLVFLGLKSFALHVSCSLSILGSSEAPSSRFRSPRHL